MTADPLAFLNATLDAAQAPAEAAGGEEWAPQGHPSDPVAIYDSKREPVVYDEGWPSPEQVAHIVGNSPAAVLRRIAADRKLIALHATVADHGRFSDRNCEEAGCDGDHWQPPVCRSCRNYAGDPVEAPCATVEILAEGWGWTEETT